MCQNVITGFSVFAGSSLLQTHKNKSSSAYVRASIYVQCDLIYHDLFCPIHICEAVNQ